VVSFDGPNAPATSTLDRMLVAVGRSPNGKLIAAESAGAAVDDCGFIPVDKQLRTNVAHIFAIGDVIGPGWADGGEHEPPDPVRGLAGELLGDDPAEGGAEHVRALIAERGERAFQPRGAATLDQTGDPVPVEVIGVDLGQRPGDAQLGQPCHAPVVHEQPFLAHGLCRHDRLPLARVISDWIILVIVHQL
jgi:hypothetical protein